MPKVGHLDVPAWPEALDYLRKTQLVDGGWGEPHILYAHERTLATLAAIYALHTWQTDAKDDIRIQRAIKALHHYADLLPGEPDEPIGFELLLPSLWRQFDPQMQADFPLKQWERADRLYEQKVSLTTSKLLPDPARPRTWWFSMETLSQAELTMLDNRFLSTNGSIASGTAPTAAYLRAKRLSGHDSPWAEAFLSDLIKRGSGSVPCGDPFEVFERIWVLDSLRRAGESPHNLSIVQVLDSLHRSWHLNDPGLSFSDLFPVNDGDDIAVGLILLQWGGYRIDIQPLLDLWDSDHFCSYSNERGGSVSVNMHALVALRNQPGFPHRKKAMLVTQWLVDHMQSDIPFADKWHISPLYSASHAIEAFAGLDNIAAQRCISFLTHHQHDNGGWGWFGSTTMEETALCVTGLAHAFLYGLFDNTGVLARAAQFMRKRADNEIAHSLWIGKGLYRSDPIVRASIYAAHKMLAHISSEIQIPYWMPAHIATFEEYISGCANTEKSEVA
ncbi:MAG: hypothetical protein JXB07_21805 [Anaerolineae bacterium]|nr:hypothetical protein [Anaerolineae bacterium]